MARKASWALAVVLLLAALAPAASSPWGALKKIHFYETSGDLAEVRRNLEHLDAQGLPPDEKSSLLLNLSELGDRFAARRDYALAEAFYRKALTVAPEEAWPVYNKLERVARARGRFIWNFAGVWRQFGLVARSFSGAYMLLDGLFSGLLFSGLLLLFLVAFALACRYFKLAAHDVIIESRARFSVPRLLLLLLLLVWPLAITGGWGFYPFLLCGLLWSYCSHDERTNLRRVLSLLLALAFVYSLGQYLEHSLRSPGFQTVRQVYSGRLFPESSWSRFDNEVKVMQAYAYFHSGQPDAALDILQATGTAYASPLKYHLLGSLSLEKGNLPQSIQYYRQSLSLDDRDPVTLKNFTVALLRHNDPELFVFYAKNYPRLNQLKDTVSVLQKERLPERILWRRLLNFSWQDFHFWHFLEVVLLGFLRLPVLLAVLIAWVYMTLLKRFFPTLGQSIFCNKCGKIIRKAPIEQAPSHALCEDCYQLFLIKDPIFLEAKLLKEKEINRQFRLRNALLLALTLVVPGFLLNVSEKSRVFTPLFLLVCVPAALVLANTLNFKGAYGAVPMFLNLLGIAAVAVYVAVNAYSLKVYADGF